MSSGGKKIGTGQAVSTVVWRPATGADLDDVVQIGAQIHVELPESRETLAEKLALFPHGCFVLMRNETALGYALSHPWLLDEIPKLNQPLLRLPKNPNCMLIHDVAILTEGRGYGASAALINLITTLARERNIAVLALVSVYGSYHLWSRFGFEAKTDDVWREKLKSYGDSARYMICKLP
jgi:hypothetical protein